MHGSWQRPGKTHNRPAREVLCASLHSPQSGKSLQQPHIASPPLHTHAAHLDVMRHRRSLAPHCPKCPRTRRGSGYVHDFRMGPD